MIFLEKDMNCTNIMIKETNYMRIITDSIQEEQSKLCNTVV